MNSLENEIFLDDLQQLPTSLAGWTLICSVVEADNPGQIGSSQYSQPPE